MKLILVHGRSQGGKDAKALKQEWIAALDRGLKAANAKLPLGIEIEFPYYGDTLDRLVEETETPLGRDALARGAESDRDDGFRKELLLELAHGAGITDAQIEAELDRTVRERGPLNWEWVQGVLKAVDRVPGLSSTTVDLFTRDVYVYLSFPGVRRAIDKIVNDSLGNGPCVVLAHSLGTVVAYNVLCARPAEPRYPRFVTVGSPLAVTAIKKRLESPLRSPRCVAHWFNAYDERDVVALRALDAKNFPVTPTIENKRDVRNHTDNRHGIDGYLSDPVVAKKIAELLS